MSDTRKRPTCPACGGFRFEVAGVDRLRCQGEGCGAVLEWRAGWTWSNFRPRYQTETQYGAPRQTPEEALRTNLWEQVLAERPVTAKRADDGDILEPALGPGRITAVSRFRGPLPPFVRSECMSCHAQVSPTALFCPECGSGMTVVVTERGRP